MTPVYHLRPDVCICDWLMRVNTQYDEDTPEKVNIADKGRAKQALERNTIYNLFFSSPQPTSRGGFFSGDTTINSNNRTYIDNSIRVDLPSNKKKTKEEKTTWKSIAAIGVMSTAVAGICIFVYARLSKAVEGAVNHLENTTKIEKWSEKCSRMNASSDPKIFQITQKISQIAHTQLEIDKRAVDKITNYKYAVLTSLVGTLAMAGGGITILASVPVLATAGIAMVVTGGVLHSLAIMYTAYNCGIHWSDAEEGKKAFDQVKQSTSIPDLIKFFKTNSQPSHYHAEHSSRQPPAYSEFQPSKAPPSYNESQFIYNQRVNPNQIYPDLSNFDFPVPSAPSYESLQK